MWRGRYTIRRAAELAANLPPGSESWRAIHAPAEWDQGDYIAAAIFDRLGAKDSKPYPRPADMREKAAGDARAQLMAEKFRRKHGKK